ncbi:MAG TPA: hypothetical protein VGU90_00105, partial [Terriglobales bacterium]|nr:hypothetical protein [Terriglobales bacterium]
MRLLFLVALLLAIPAICRPETPRKSDLRSATSHVSAESLDLRQPRPLSLRQIIHDSALIFSGTVLHVKRVGPEPTSSAGISQISFRVQNAIRGTRRGQVIEIREWGGLWTTGERYTAGENVLLFLYPNSKLGLTSPIGGRAGRLRVDKTGRVEIGKENTA